MVNTSRSRTQLQKGVILKKWNGAPLLVFDQSKPANEDQPEQIKQQISISIQTVQKENAEEQDEPALQGISTEEETHRLHLGEKKAA